MKKVSIPVTARNILEKKMPGAVRKAYKSGAEIHVKIMRTGRPLYRWGRECELLIRRGIILKNSMAELAWNWDEQKAFAEAANAIDYMVYGNEDEYKIAYRI